jgi:hypothetical protein
LFKTIHLSAVTVSGKEADAKKVYESVKSGKTTFEEAEKANAKNAGGELGVKFAYELKTPIADDSAREKVIALEKGALSDLVKSAAGWTFFRCQESAQSPAAGDQAVLAKAREYITTFERGKVEDWLIAKANAFAQEAGSGNFSKAASASGVAVKKFGPVALNYGDIELLRSISSFKLPELAGASTNEAFLKTAFTTKTAAVAKPVVVGDSVIVLRVVDERSADESSMAVIDFYYPYVVGQYSDKQIRDHFLGSKKLNDKFYDTFVKYFLPQ